MTDNKNKNRRIRSFVRRSGRITTRQQRGLDQDWQLYGLELQDGKLDFQAVFKRSAPIVLEIGFGMGQSLVAMAESAVDKDFIGIEVFEAGVGSLLSELTERELNNVRIYSADALEVLTNCIPDNCLDLIQIFFPDPWPKKRHHKRRLIQSEFVNLLLTKLKTGGQLHLATDWQDYAEQMLAVLSAFPQLVNQAGDGNYLPRPASRPLTKFEQRGARLGHGVWDLLFQRQS